MAQKHAISVALNI